jgi:hypothetical protein
MDGVNKSGDSALRASFFFLRRLWPVAISGVAGCEQNFLLLFCDLDRDLKAEAVVKTASAVVSHYDRETSEFTWNSGTPRQLPGWSFWGHKELALEFPWNLTISNYLIRPNQLNSRVRMPGEFQD